MYNSNVVYEFQYIIYKEYELKILFMIEYQIFNNNEC